MTEGSKALIRGMGMRVLRAELHMETANGNVTILVIEALTTEQELYHHYHC